MAGKALLDTNIAIGILNGDPAILEELAACEAVYLCRTVVGELYYGAYNSTRVDENVRRLEEFAVANEVLGDEAGIAREYGRTKARLRVKGSPLPDNDLWIAATAIHYDLTLVTRDAHFSEIDGIRLEAW